MYVSGGVSDHLAAVKTCLTLHSFPANVDWVVLKTAALTFVVACQKKKKNLLKM